MRKQPQLSASADAVSLLGVSTKLVGLSIKMIFTAMAVI
jgi:hypothetical protein